MDSEVAAHPHLYMRGFLDLFLGSPYPVGKRSLDRDPVITARAGVKHALCVGFKVDERPADPETGGHRPPAAKNLV